MVKVVSVKVDENSYRQHMDFTHTYSYQKSIVDIGKLGFDSDKLRNFMELAELRSIKQARKKKNDELLCNPAPTGEVIMTLEQYLAEVAPPFTGHLDQTPVKSILQKKPICQMNLPGKTNLPIPEDQPECIITPLSTRDCTPKNSADQPSSTHKKRVSFAPNNIVLLYSEDPWERELDCTQSNQAKPSEGINRPEKDRNDEVSTQY